jgi:hypothetical protein
LLLDAARGSFDLCPESVAASITRQDDSLARQLRRVSRHGCNILPTQRRIEPQDLIGGIEPQLLLASMSIGDPARLVRPAVRTVCERGAPSGLLEGEYHGVIYVLSHLQTGRASLVGEKVRLGPLVNITESWLNQVAIYFARRANALDHKTWNKEMTFIS